MEIRFGIALNTTPNLTSVYIDIVPTIYVVNIISMAKAFPYTHTSFRFCGGKSRLSVKKIRKPTSNPFLVTARDYE